MHQFTLVLLSCLKIIKLKGSSIMVNLAKLFCWGRGKKLITRNKLRGELKMSLVLNDQTSVLYWFEWKHKEWFFIVNGSYNAFECMVTMQMV